MLISNPDSPSNDFKIFLSIIHNDDNNLKNLYKTSNNDDFDILYYYPNNVIHISDTCSVSPIDQGNTIKFYKANKTFYDQIASNVKFLIAFNGKFTAFKTAIANYVKIINNYAPIIDKDEISQTTLLTTFSLIKIENVQTDDDVEKIQIFMVNSLNCVNGTDTESNVNLQALLKRAEFVTSKSLDISQKFLYLDALIQEFDLIKLETNKEMMKYRAQFIKFVENTKYDYIFRDPLSHNLVTPALDILFLNSNFMTNIYEPIKIEINQLENSILDSNDITFITYHLPNQISNLKFNRTRHGRKKLKTPRKKDKRKNLNNDDIITDNLIIQNYKNFVKNSEFAKNCCIFYEKTANFGKLNENIFNSFLLVGYFNFNTFSTGTIIFNHDFIPIGIAYFNSIEFYSIKKCNENYNLIIPFNHLGLLFLFRKLLKDEISLSDYFKEKNIDNKTMNNLKMKKKLLGRKRK